MTFSHIEKEAINYLRTQVSLEILWEVYTHQNDPTWLARQHFGLGLWTRNTLRAAGFAWDDLALDARWPVLITAMVEQAAKGEGWL